MSQKSNKDRHEITLIMLSNLRKKGPPKKDKEPTIELGFDQNEAGEDREMSGDGKLVESKPKRRIIRPKKSE